MEFLLATIQSNAQNNIDENVDYLIQKMHKAKENGADFIATAESVFFMQKNREEMLNNVYLMDKNPYLKVLRDKAKDLKTWLLLGSIGVKLENSDKLANRSILINSDGNIECYYDKIHLYDADLKEGESHKESYTYAHGDKAITAETPWIKVGLTICYDLRFPYLYRALAKQGAELIFTPSAFTEYTGKLHWEILNRARAIENSCYVVAPAQYGKHPGNRKTFGHSMVIDPWGKIIDNTYDYKDLIITKINKKNVIETRKQILSLKHDREFEIVS